MNRIATILGVAALTFLTSFPVEAKPQNSNQNYYRRIRVTFTPAGKGHPRYTSAAAVRSTKCNVGAASSQKSLTAIVPSNSQSLTNKSHPTFFAYIPAMGASHGTLYIKDETEDFFYTQKVDLPSEGGVVGVTMSQEIPGLEQGSYSWFLQIQCGDSPAIDDPVVGANVHKVDGENSALWYDIAAESANSPLWGDLMNQINLDSLADKNVVFIN